MKVAGRCDGQKILVEKIGKMEKSTFGRSLGQKNGQGKVLIWCRKKLGISEAKNGTKAGELLQT